MKPIKYRINIYQEASWKLLATFNDAAGNPIDLSNYGGELHIRDSVADAAPILSLTDIGGDIIFGAGANNLTIKMTATQTTDLPTNNSDIDDWVYDFKMYDKADPENTTIRLLQGGVRVFAAVTRD